MIFAAPKIDDLLELNSNWLSKHGLLKPGQYSVSWSSPHYKASVSLTARQDFIELSYETKSIEVVEEVEIEWAKCGAGGRRAYFRCPKCGKRCYKLFLRGYRWVCRSCTGLLYRVQVEDELDKAFRRSRKLRERLGASMRTCSPVEKPKGMHSLTFFQLYGRLIQEEERIVNFEADKLGLL